MRAAVCVNPLPWTEVDVTTITEMLYKNNWVNQNQNNRRSKILSTANSETVMGTRQQYNPFIKRRSAEDDKLCSWHWSVRTSKCMLSHLAVVKWTILRSLIYDISGYHEEPTSSPRDTETQCMGCNDQMHVQRKRLFSRPALRLVSRASYNTLSAQGIRLIWRKSDFQRL